MKKEIPKGTVEDYVRRILIEEFSKTKMTYKDLGLKLNKSRSVASQTLNNYRITINNYYNLCTAFNVDPIDLLRKASKLKKHYEKRN